MSGIVYFLISIVIFIAISVLAKTKMITPMNKRNIQLGDIIWWGFLSIAWPGFLLACVAGIAIVVYMDWVNGPEGGD